MVDQGPVQLSICIPTFNRADLLPETLASIEPQLRNDVEVVILDGGSSDGTETVMDGWVRRIQNLRYIRREVNSGVDRDADDALRQARGRYCWFMSSDDIVRPGAVEAILEAIEKRPSIVVLNSEVRDFSLERVLDPRSISIQDDRVYERNDMADFFAEMAAPLSFMPRLVIDRALWLNRDRDTYFGSDFIHVGVVFQAPLPSAAVVLAEPYLSIRYGNWTWADRHTEIWMFKWPELLWTVGDWKPVDRSAAWPLGSWRDISRLVPHRAAGGFDRGLVDRFITGRRLHGLKRVAVKAIAATPISVARTGVRVAYQLQRRPDALDHLKHTRTIRRVSGREPVR